MIIATTPRLILRTWLDSDTVAFARLNADPQVMEYFPAPLTELETLAMLKLIEEKMRSQGFGLWATERKDTGEFIGFVGLNVPGFEAPFMPAVEIGWRLAKEHWGMGFATEGARAALDVAWRLGIPEIVSFTSVNNERSRRVMEKIGMTHDAASDFDHPKIAEGHPLRRHVLYRIRAGV